MANLREAKEEILHLAEADILFKNALRDNPKDAIEKHFPDFKVPASINFKVVEDSEDTIFLNIDANKMLKAGY